MRLSREVTENRDLYGSKVHSSVGGKAVNVISIAWVRTIWKPGHADLQFSLRYLIIDAMLLRDVVP